MRLISRRISLLIFFFFFIFISLIICLVVRTYYNSLSWIAIFISLTHPSNSFFYQSYFLRFSWQITSAPVTCPLSLCFTLFFKNKLTGFFRVSLRLFYYWFILFSLERAISFLLTYIMLQFCLGIFIFCPFVSSIKFSWGFSTPHSLRFDYFYTILCFYYYIDLIF